MGQSLDKLLMTNIGKQHLSYIQILSSLWLDYVLVLSVTSICLQNQTFDFIKSSVCPAGPTYVLNLSPDSEQIGR